MGESNIDLSKLAQGEDKQKAADDQQPEVEITGAIVPADISNQAVVQNPDIVWIEATQGLQRNLIRSLQDYKATRSDKRALAVQRERMITEVTDQYVSYLREEARLSSKAALEARDSILRQELARLKSKLFTELADITGASVGEIERIAQSHSSRMTSPAIQQAYAKFVMSKILDLLEQK